MRRARWSGWIQIPIPVRISNSASPEHAVRSGARLDHAHQKLSEGAMEQAKIDAEALAAGLTDENESMEERQEKLDEMLAERDEEIERLKALKPEEEIAERDAEIRKLEEQKRKLTHKLKEAGKPNLDRFLKDCIKWQSDVNVGLADLVDNRDELDQGDWKKFCGLLKNAFITLKGASKDGALQLEDK